MSVTVLELQDFVFLAVEKARRTQKRAKCKPSSRWLVMLSFRKHGEWHACDSACVDVSLPSSLRFPLFAVL